jgi:hypothetical protein
MQSKYQRHGEQIEHACDRLLPVIITNASMQLYINEFILDRGVNFIVQER